MSRLERVIDRLFDYAGMFPPAALELHAALKESAALPQTLRRPHLLAADLVVTPTELALLSDDTLRSAGFTPEHEVKVCLVGVPLDQAPDAVDRIRAFHAGARGSEVPKRVVALEIASERDLQAGLPTTVAALKHVAQATTGLGIALYYEPRWPPDKWTKGLERVIALLQEVGREGIVAVGLKVRCAGPTALGPKELAPIVAAVADQHTPFKATQGLHHALVDPDHHDSEAGFLGLVAAHRLRAGLGETFGIEDIATCIQETQKDAFSFDEGIAWKTHRLDGSDLDQALVMPVNIGSCSLHEPDEDLVRLYGPPAD